MGRQAKQVQPSSASRVAQRLRMHREFARPVGEVFPEVRSITITGTMTNFDVQKFSRATELRVSREDKFPLHIECICWDCEDGGESHASGITLTRRDFEDAIAKHSEQMELRMSCHGWASYKYRNVSHCSVILKGTALIEYEKG